MNKEKNNLTLQDSITNTIFEIWQQADKETQLQISGNSMNPMIKNGDWLVLKHNSNDIKIGSIIAYRREQKIIVHRVIKIDHNSLITKGDFNFHVDPVVDVKNIIGKVIAVKNRKRLFRIDTIYWNIVAYIIASFPLIFTRISRFLS